MTACPVSFAWRNPLGASDFLLSCIVESDDDGAHLGGHEATYTGTKVTWQDHDRRSFTGEFPGWCTLTEGCVLPAGHRPECAT